MRREPKPPVDFSTRFLKQRKAAPLDVKTAFRETLEIYLDNPESTILRNHPLDKLGKKYFGIWSIDVTSDWRVLYRKKSGRTIFVELGTHDKLYKK